MRQAKKQGAPDFSLGLPGQRWAARQQRRGGGGGGDGQRAGQGAGEGGPRFQLPKNQARIHASHQISFPGKKKECGSICFAHMCIKRGHLHMRHGGDSLEN